MFDETTLLIGSGNRSTLRGIENAAEIMKPYGVDVVPVEFLAKWNHLDMIFTVLADKLAMVCEEAIPPSFAKFLADKGWRTISCPAPEVLITGNNVLAIGDDRIISFEENTVVNKMLQAEGFKLFTPPLREFTKMGGGPHCLTFELERDK
jgi:N-dimethylarginine dimethylaminohydrolase